MHAGGRGGVLARPITEASEIKKYDLHNRDFVVDLSWFEMCVSKEFSRCTELWDINVWICDQQEVNEIQHRNGLYRQNGRG